MPDDASAGAAGDFSVKSRVGDGSLEVVVSGDLDMAAAFRLESGLDRLLAEGDVRGLVLDLAEVGFVDSAGLGALLSIRERAQQLGIGLEVSRASDPVQRVLDLTGSSELLRRDRA
jgi:anti-anti-sigma factor